MDRNSIIGLSLIFLILIGFWFVNKPNMEEIERQRKVQDSIAAVEKRKADSVMLAAQPQKTQQTITPDSLGKMNDSLREQVNRNLGPFASHMGGQEQLITLENDRLRVVLSNHGGQPHLVELKNYKKARDGVDSVSLTEPLVLFEGDEHRLNYNFATLDGFNINTSELFFEVNRKDSASVTFIAKTAKGQSIEQHYVLQPNSYQVDYQLSVKGFDQLLNRSNNYLVMNWDVEMQTQEKSAELERDKSSIFYSFTNGDHDNISETKYEKEELEGAVRWVSFKQQFFNATLIADGKEGFEDVKVETKEADDAQHVEKMGTELYIPYNMGPEETQRMRFFYGPNHHQTLKQLDIGMESLVPLGWGIFGWVNRFLVIPIFNWLNNYFSSYGLIILLLTLIVKALLFPLVYRSYISTAKMRTLKPEMDEIKEKFAGDPQKLQMENMKLFKKAGVSPLGGCLPMLLQMPILIAMFVFFPVSFELRQEPFLWAEDLSSYDSIWTFGYVPLINTIYGDHVSLFTLLMTISTLIYTRMNNEISGLTGSMKYMGYIMPIVFLGVFNNYSAGLSYYYFLSNMITFGQQWVMRRFVDQDKLHRQIQENKKKPVKKSRFQERLEKMAKDRGLDTRRK